eukprot:scaffold45401_cov63-Phaeocystis_antarctica.AAC.2
MGCSTALRPMLPRCRKSSPRTSPRRRRRNSHSRGGARQALEAAPRQPGEAAPPPRPDCAGTSSRTAQHSA